MLRFFNAVFILGALGVLVAGYLRDDGEMMLFSVAILVIGELTILKVQARREWWAFFGEDIDDTR